MFHPDWFSGWRVRLTLLSLILLMTAWIYAPASTFEPLNWDDDAYLFENAQVTQGLSQAGFQYAWSQRYPYFMPLVWLSFMSDITLFGVDPGAIHQVNLMWHLFNTGLLAFWLFRLTGHVWRTSFVTACFALHGQHVEVVAWITERRELLGFFFGMLALLSFQQALISTARSRTFHLLALLAFLASLLSKPVWITLPAVLLLIDYWPLQRHDLGLLRAIKEKIPFFALSAGYILFATINQSLALNFASLSQISLTQRLIDAISAISHYLTTTLVPWGLLPSHAPAIPLPWPSLLLAGLALLILTAIAWRYRHPRPALLIGWLWFLGTLLPVIGVARAGATMTVEDHFTYLPHVGLFMAMAWGILPANMRHPWSIQATTLLIACGFVVMLGLSTRHHLPYWKNSPIFWQNIIDHTPNNHFAHWMLGQYLQKKGQPEQALPHFQEAHRQNPHEPDYVLTLGNLLIRQGDVQQGWAMYQKLVTTAPGDVTMLTNLGWACIQDQNWHNARIFLEKAIEKPPSTWQKAYFEAHFLLGMVQFIQGEPEEGNRHFTLFFHINPDLKDERCLWATGLLDHWRQQGISWPSEMERAIQTVCPL